MCDRAGIYNGKLTVNLSAFGTFQLSGLVVALAVPSALADGNSWTLASPDGHCEIRISTDRNGSLGYSVSRDGKPVLRNSPLGLCRDDQAFVSGLKIKSAGEVHTRIESYELFSGVQSRVERQLNGRSLVFFNTNNSALILDLAASDQGVAFRYRFDDRSDARRVIEKELSGFRVASNVRGWLQPYHAAGPYTPAYEDFFFSVAPGTLPPESRGRPVGWCFPALFHVPQAESWILISESGTDGAYAGCHLAPDSADGLYRIEFPLPDEHTAGQGTNSPSSPSHALPWSLPWRVIVIGGSAGDIATSTLVTDLAPPSRVSDTSWIRPGRASWAWWSHPDGPATKELFNEFTDFARRMKWEYTLFDAGWWTPGLKTISQYAVSNGIAPLAWLHASDFYSAEKRARKLDEMAAAGIRGVKVDFWCSDRQESLAAMEDLFRDAAARRLVVNLHGCTLPRGWNRTWPNFLTAEAVLGTESYFYESRYTEKAAELNTVLPFTRNAVGPMDVTPVACSPKKFARTTTACHELAASIIATSGLIHFADSPGFFESLPAPALEVLRDAPARWEETRCLAGEPGRMVIFARRSGRSWFIAGINGTASPIPVALDLSPFGEMSRRLLISEGTNVLMQVAATIPGPGRTWHHEMPPRGGFILRLDR